MPHHADLYTFNSVFIHKKTSIFLLAQIDSLVEMGSERSSLLRLSMPNAQWAARHFEWSGIKLWVSPLDVPEIIILGSGGEILRAIPGNPNSDEEMIDEGPEGVKYRGPMRDLRRIGEHLYAAGMGRQVYRREGPSQWSRADAGVVQPIGHMSKDGNVAGFNAIDGISEDDIYAVGFGGEIWRREKGRWRQLDSPTGVVLTGLKVVRPDLAYAIGQRGVLLEGKGDAWRAIDHQATEDDLWGIEWFKDHLYVSSAKGVFRLALSGDLQPVDMGLGTGRTYYDLHANDGVLWSVGPKHLSWTDGSKWMDISS
jgi:hypothetical protein